MALALSSTSFLSTLSSPRRTTPFLLLSNLSSRQPSHSGHTSIHLPFRRFSTCSRYPFLLCSSSMPSEVSTFPSQLENCFLHSKAFWVSESLIAWNVGVGDGRCCLYGSWSASLSVADDGIQGYDARIEIVEDSDGLPANVVEKFPHIRDYKAFRVPAGVDIKSLLKSQLAVASFSSDGKCSDATGLQLPGILDEQFSYDGPLGASYAKDVVSLYLWAPTAQTVRACIYSENTSAEPREIVEMKETNGVWSVVGPKDWEGCYYNYEVCVYHPSTLSIQKCYANDPYARGLSSDGQRTLLVDLASNDLKPEGWDKLADYKPSVVSFSDITLYELHIRDFSAYDQTVDPHIRGGYLAFTLKDSAGVHHLKKLSNAGITHVHLLPTFQFAGVDDVKENWKSIDEKMLESLPPDSEEQQAQITAIQNNDGYNWGYNPVLWGVPKGSYASNPNGPTRITEFRKMIQALNHIGLRVVLDVVYNHLQGSGPFHEDSVLDKIVPGYYLRRNTDGLVEHSTCMNNTASEHYMVERLIIDDLSNWVVNYKVDGFRFDLMGHIMKRTMEKAKDALCSLTREKDGIDGSSIYLYGEGWDFGEVSQNGRGINASQYNISGTGIGSFNDRIRDAVLGGSPFGHPLQQGFLTGLMLQPNGHDHGGRDNEEAMLATAKDHIQVGMAANLRNFELTDHVGKKIPKEVLELGYRELKKALVGQIVGNSPPLRVIQALVNKLWGYEGRIAVSILPNGLLLFEFPSEALCDWVLKRLWHIYSQPLFLRRWSKHLEPIIVEPADTPVWVTFLNVPPPVCNHLGVGVLSSAVGRPLNKFTRLGTTVKVCVLLREEDERPKTVTVAVDGEDYAVEVEFPTAKYFERPPHVQKEWRKKVPEAVADVVSEPSQEGEKTPHGEGTSYDAVGSKEENMEGIPTNSVVKNGKVFNQDAPKTVKSAGNSDEIRDEQLSGDKASAEKSSGGKPRDEQPTKESSKAKSDGNVEEGESDDNISNTKGDSSGTEAETIKAFSPENFPPLKRGGRRGKRR